MAQLWVFSPGKISNRWLCLSSVCSEAGVAHLTLRTKNLLDTVACMKPKYRGACGWPIVLTF